MTSTEFLKNIISKAERVGDEAIYVSIFNKLSHFDSIKNYSYNNNGIFFNLNKIDESVLHELNDMLDNYATSKNDIMVFEEKRSKKIDEMKKTMNNLTHTRYKKDIVDYLEGKTECSTQLNTSTKKGKEKWSGDKNDVIGNETVFADDNSDDGGIVLEKVSGVTEDEEDYEDLFGTYESEEEF
jgi:hypothetical protein